MRFAAVRALTPQPPARTAPIVHVLVHAADTVGGGILTLAVHRVALVREESRFRVCAFFDALARARHRHHVRRIFRSTSHTAVRAVRQVGVLREGGRKPVP